jgi:hypothetical protein
MDSLVIRRKSARVSVVLMLFLFFSCSREENPRGPMGEAFSQSTPSVIRSTAPMEGGALEGEDAEVSSSSLASDQGSAPSIGLGERKIVKSGHLSLAVPSIESMKQAEAFIRQEVAVAGGALDQESENRYGNQATLMLLVRISAEKFEGFVQKILGGPYTVVNRQIGINEVTDRYIDLDVRLKNKKELRERYREILKKATKTADLIALSQSIETATSEIESLEGQFRYLKSQIANSSLTIQLTANLPEPVGLETSFLQDLSKAFHDGSRSFQQSIIRIFSLWPLLLLAAACFGLWRWYRRRGSGLEP